MTKNRQKSKTTGGIKGYGIDYDFKSQYMVLSRLEPLIWLHKRGTIKVKNIAVYTSPSGRGWHVRFDCDCNIPRRVIELMGGDDPWRHAYSVDRGEHDNAPLFQHKYKSGTKYSEKYNEQMTERVKKAFEVE